MRNEHKVFLGIGENDEAVYAEITFGRNEIVDGELVRQGYFAVSFTSALLEVTNDERDSELMSERVDEFDMWTVGDLLKRHSNLTYNDLADFILNHDGRQALYDVCNFLPQFTFEDGDEVFFNIVGGGQHDSRYEFIYDDPAVNEVHFRKHEQAMFAVPFEWFLKLHELWDEFHLKHYPGDDYSYNSMTAEEEERLNKFEAWTMKIIDLANSKMEDICKEFIEDHTQLAIKN
jgi:hypothetical protein